MGGIVALKKIQQIYQIETVTSVRDAANDFITYCESVLCLSKKTMTTRKTHLKQFTEFCTAYGVSDIKQVSNYFIDEYFTYFTETHAKSTANTGRRIVKVFLRWLSDYREMTVARPELIRLVKVRDAAPRSLDVSIIRQVIKACEEPQDALMIGLTFEAGLRIGELANLTVADIVNDNLYIQGKGEIDRHVYITDAVAEAVATHIESYGLQPHDKLIRNVHGTWDGAMSLSTIRKRMQRCFVGYAGIEMYPHQLRHSLAVYLLESGCDIVTIQKILGHKDITTTQEYLKVANTYVKKNYKKYIGASVL